MAPFKSQEELRKVLDRLFDALSREPSIGPRLRALRTPQRYVFTDAALVLNVRDADEKRARKGHNLLWVWGDAKRTWEPVVTMHMTAAVANRYLQGKENIPLAIARKVILLETGDLAKVLDFLPIVAPYHKTWVSMLKADGLNHLIA